MTEEQIDIAADLWRRRSDTLAIAEFCRLPEHTVYENLWRIRLRAQKSRVA
jgi:hypothetical protein